TVLSLSISSKRFSSSPNGISVEFGICCIAYSAGSLTSKIIDTLSFLLASTCSFVATFISVILSTPILTNFKIIYFLQVNRLILASYQNFLHHYSNYLLHIALEFQ